MNECVARYTMRTGCRPSMVREVLVALGLLLRHRLLDRTLPAAIVGTPPAVRGQRRCMAQEPQKQQQPRCSLRGNTQMAAAAV